MWMNLGIVVIALLVAACAPAGLSSSPSPGHLSAQSASAGTATIPRPVMQAVPLPPPRSVEKTETYKDGEIVKGPCPH